MTAYGPPAVPRSTASPDQRAALLSYVAGGLGLLSFVWGFLKWLTEGSGSEATKYGGYALGAPGVAVIGLSLVAGLLAASLAWEKKAASLAPVVISVSGMLLAFGVLIGKGSLSAGSSDGPKIGLGIGLILTLITVIVQVGVLLFAWMAASGKIPARPAQAWPGQPGQSYPGQPYPGQPGQSYPGQPGQSYPGQPGQPGQAGQPAQPGQAAQPGQPGGPAQSGGYGPPQTYGTPQPHPGGPPQQQEGYGPPQQQEGYGPPPQAGPTQTFGPPPGQ